MEGDWDQPMSRLQKAGCAIAVIVIVLIIAVLVFPAIVEPGPNPNRACLSNLKQCIVGQLAYAADHDDHLPRSTVWMDALATYVKPNALKCPILNKEKDLGYGYAMNRAMSGIQTKSVKAPEEMPVLFDSVLLVRNATSGFYGFPDPKERKTTVAYIDGHAGIRKVEAK